MKLYSYVISYLFFYFMSFPPVQGGSSRSGNRIAIIGAGVSGISCAYFLKHDLKNKAAVDIYENDRPGGRVGAVHYAEKIYEAGATIIHPSHFHLAELLNEFGMTTLIHNLSIDKLAIHDGQRFIFPYNLSLFDANDYSSMSSGTTNYMATLKKFLQRVLRKFENIYTLQHARKTYETVTELLIAIDPQFAEYVEMSADTGFESIVELPSDFIKAIIEPAIKLCYGQDLNVSFLVGIISAIQLFDSNYQVKDGNQKLLEKILHASGAKFLKKHVSTIHYVKETDQYNVLSVDSYGIYEWKLYDHVIIATPITENDTSGLSFENIPEPDITGKYHITFSTFIYDETRNEKFKAGKKQNPSVVLFPKNSATAGIISVHSIDGEMSKKKVWKVLSNNPLRQSDLQALFQKYAQEERIMWKAYPEYQFATSHNRKFKLHNSLYYINAIEWAASTMEMSVIGAKNVALQIKKKMLIL